MFNERLEFLPWDLLPSTLGKREEIVLLLAHRERERREKREDSGRKDGLGKGKMV